MPMELGIYTFAETPLDPATGRQLGAGQRLRDLLEEIELADQVGLDVFGVGEHHRPDYAVSWPEERDLIRETARRTGIVLDPVYTGKVFFGLMDQVRKGRFAAGDRILFLHTGGIYGLLAQADTFGLKV